MRWLTGSLLSPPILEVIEEKTLKQLRTLVPHAGPVPNFANPFVPQKSCEETTKAKSPKLCVLRGKERKGLSGDDIKAAAILMR